MESVDDIRLCPEDHERIENTNGRVTSYAMNGFLQDPAKAYPPSSLPPSPFSLIRTAAMDFTMPYREPSGPN